MKIKPLSAARMVSGCPFPSKRLKYNKVSGAVSVQACHCHAPTAPPSTQTPPRARPPRAAVLGRDLGGLAGPGGIGMAKPAQSKARLDEALCNML